MGCPTESLGFLPAVGQKQLLVVFCFFFFLVMQTFPTWLLISSKPGREKVSSRDRAQLLNVTSHRSLCSVASKRVAGPSYLPEEGISTSE